MEKRGSANHPSPSSGTSLDPAASTANDPEAPGERTSAIPSTVPSAPPYAGGYAGRPPRKQRLREKRPDRFAELIRIATRALAHEGYAAMNVNRIAEEAGIGVGTLYNYFDDKDDLFLTCVAAASANDLRVKKERIDLDRPALESLRALLRADRELAASDPDGQQLLRAAFYGISSHLPAGKLAQEMSRGGIALIEQVLERGVAQKIFALAKNEVLPCAVLIHGLMETFHLHFPTDEKDGETRAFELLCRGILTKQARAAEKIS